MYNTVLIETDCPVCGSKLDDFQTKNMSVTIGKQTFYIESILQKLSLIKEMNGKIHDICVKCKSFIECDVEKGKIKNCTFELNEHQNQAPDKPREDGKKVYGDL